MSKNKTTGVVGSDEDEPEPEEDQLYSNMQDKSKPTLMVTMYKDQTSKIRTTSLDELIFDDNFGGFNKD